MSFWTSPNLHPKIKSRFIVTFGTGFSLPNVKTVDKPSVEVSTKEYRLMNHFFNYPGLVKWQPIKITFVDMNGAGGQFDTAQMLYEMLKNSGYIHPTESEHGLGKRPKGNAASSPISSPEKASTIANSFGNGLYEETNYSPEAPNANIRSIRIQQIDFGFSRKGTPAGGVVDLRGVSGDSQPQAGNAFVVEQWELINPIITNISWGSLDYGSDDLVECTLDIKYDWAEHTKPNKEKVVTTNAYQKFSK
jgi:hypothetical protein